MICDLKINQKQPHTLICQKNRTTMTIRLAQKRGRIHGGTMITNNEHIRGSSFHPAVCKVVRKEDWMWQ